MPVCKLLLLFLLLRLLLLNLCKHPFASLVDRPQVAEGAAHVYPRLAPTSEWDTCAAHAIVECAGGKVGWPCGVGCGCLIGACGRSKPRL